MNTPTDQPAVCPHCAAGYNGDPKTVNRFLCGTHVLGDRGKECLSTEITRLRAAVREAAEALSPFVKRNSSEEAIFIAVKTSSITKGRDVLTRLSAF